MSHTPQPEQVPPFPGGQPAQPAAKPKKPWFKKWWVWVLGVIVLVGAANALGGGGGSQTAAPTNQTSSGGGAAASAPAAPEAPKKERLTLDEGWEVDRSNQFAVYVNGYVSNNTDKPIDNYIQITFDALDKAGANLGTCLANTNTIDANGKWKFKAICTGEVKEIETVRFKELSGF